MSGQDQGQVPGRRSRFQVGGVDLGDVVARLAADHVVETPDERERRRDVEEQEALDEAQGRREEREAADRADHEARSADPVAAVRRIDIRRLL